MNTIRELKAKEKYDNMLKRKNKEIKILSNKLDMIKANINKITKEEILDIIENYTGFFSKGSDKE